MNRSRPKQIKRTSRSSPIEHTRDIPIAQSLPANYLSNRCPRAPLQRPRETYKIPPSFNLPESLPDFQSDYLKIPGREKISYSLSKYTGPAISASMPTWGKNPFLTKGGVSRQAKSRLEPIPLSLTSLCMLDEDNKNSFGEEKKPWDIRTLKVQTVDQSRLSDSEGTDEYGVDELQEDLFEMDL